MPSSFEIAKKITNTFRVTLDYLVGEEQPAAFDKQTLRRLAETHQQELDADLDILTSVLEPAMIVVIGLIIGMVIVAMYLPVFEMMNVIQ
jgi:type IV pilus assembly protein PilC